jgi:hypothetical protein
MAENTLHSYNQVELSREIWCIRVYIILPFAILKKWIKILSWDMKYILTKKYGVCQVVWVYQEAEVQRPLDCFYCILIKIKLPRLPVRRLVKKPEIRFKTKDKLAQRSDSSLNL